MSSESLDLAFQNGTAMVRAATPVPTTNPLLASTSSGRFATSATMEFRRAEEYYDHHRGRVYSAIQIPSKRIAGQNFYVGRVSRQSGSRRSLKYLRRQGAEIDVPECMKRIDPGRLEIIEGHPLAMAIDSPNEMMTRWTLFYHTVMSVMITGRAIWPFSFEDGRLQIAPVPTTWAKPLHQGRLFSHWEITIPGSPDKPIIWPGEFVVHYFFPDPANPLQPLSPIRMLARSILADEAIDTAQQVGFTNGIHPTVALVAGDGVSGTKDRPIKLEPHQRQQFINWMKQEYAGVQRYGLPIVLDALIRDVIKLSHAPEEMAFLDSSNLTESQIYMGFGVNPISAGKVQDVNRASSAMAEYHLVGNTVNPLIDMFTESFNKTLTPLFSKPRERLRAWIAPATAKDAELRMRKIALAAKYDSAKKNELRREVDLPDVSDGDVWARVPDRTPPAANQNGTAKRKRRWRLQQSR